VNGGCVVILGLSIKGDGTQERRQNVNGRSIVILDSLFYKGDRRSERGVRGSIVFQMVLCVNYQGRLGSRNGGRVGMMDAS